MMKALGVYALVWYIVLLGSTAKAYMDTKLTIGALLIGIAVFGPLLAFTLIATVGAFKGLI